jgi:hypothetical protein
MNAKELREAAQRLIDNVRLWEADKLDLDLIEVADYVLATLRDDDDDLIDADWLAEVTEGECDRASTLVSVNVTEELYFVGDIDHPQRWQVWFNEYEIGECCNRAGFRLLCRGLGIELKEGGQ